MNKTSVLGSLVSLMAAVNVGCSTQKTHSGRLDEKASSVALPGAPSQTNTGGAQPLAPETQTLAPESPQNLTSGHQALAPESSQGLTSGAQSLAPMAPDSQTLAPVSSQNLAPGTQSLAPESQSLAPGMQVSSPFTQEQAFTSPSQQEEWQAQSESQSEDLRALDSEVSPWDMVQQSSDYAQLTSDDVFADQQSAFTGNSEVGPELEPLSQDQALHQVRQWFSAEGRQGVVALTEKKLLMVERNLATISEQDAAQYKQQLEESRAQWQSLEQTSDDNAFVQQAADLLKHLSDVAVAMAQQSNNVSRS